ncbi:MAG: ribose 5-phosphate isomerase B [archaeon]
MVKIYIASDHAGFKAKEELKKFLQTAKSEFKLEDLGTNSEESVDYPDYAKRVAQKVAKEKNSFGILICGTGIGMSIAANKVKGIRAALCHNEFTAKMSRNHNDANVLCMGARILNVEEMKKIANTFLNEKFEHGRHENRIKKIEC